MKSNIRKFLIFPVLVLALLAVTAGCGLFGEEQVRNSYTLRYSTDDDYLVAVTDSVIYSMVEVYASGGGSSGSAGSGVIVHVDYNSNPRATYILTNSHVVTSDNANHTAYTRIQVRFFGDGTLYTASVATANLNGTGKEMRSVYNSKSTDLALLKVNAYAKEINAPAEFNNKRDGGRTSLKYAQRVIAIGNGQNMGTSVSDGIISNPSITLPNSNSLSCELIMFTASVNPGNSGGALFDMEGKAVGINTLKLIYDVAQGTSGQVVNVFADGMNFALPSSNIKEFLSGTAYADLVKFIE